MTAAGTANVACYNRQLGLRSTAAYVSSRIARATCMSRRATFVGLSKCRRRLPDARGLNILCVLKALAPSSEVCDLPLKSGVLLAQTGVVFAGINRAVWGARRVRSVRPATVEYDSLIGNRVGQEGEPSAPRRVSWGAGEPNVSPFGPSKATHYSPAPAPPIPEKVARGSSRLHVPSTA
jgi:hypothetical protein